MVIIVFFTACNQDTKSSRAQSESSTGQKIVDEKPTHLADVPWSAVIDSSSQKIEMRQNSRLDNSALNLQNISEALNQKYPEIRMANPYQNNDTVYVRIPEAGYLTQQSGSMGAEIFMAEVTYSFTQIPGVKFVHFSFQEGDHGSPGTYQRTDFNFYH